MHTDTLIEHIAFDAAGLVTAIAQDHQTNEVLMVAFMNEATVRQTIETGLMTYWSRSRQRVWVKGETSGYTQEVREVRLDCDGDALVFRVLQHGGAACHTGHRSCFFRRFDHGRLVQAGVQVFDPKAVYGDASGSRGEDESGSRGAGESGK